MFILYNAVKRIHRDEDVRLIHMIELACYRFNEFVSRIKYKHHIKSLLRLHVTYVKSNCSHRFPLSERKFVHLQRVRTCNALDPIIDFASPAKKRKVTFKRFNPWRKKRFIPAINLSVHVNIAVTLSVTTLQKRLKSKRK